MRRVSAQTARVARMCARVLFLSVFLIPTSGRAQSDCPYFINPTKEVSTPRSDPGYRKPSTRASDRRTREGLLSYATGQARFLCSQVEAGSRAKCHRLVARIIDRAMDCVDRAPTVKELRPLATAYMRNEEFWEMLEPAVFSDRSPETEIRLRIWNAFGVLVLPAGMPTAAGVTRQWRAIDLQAIEEGYRLLRAAVQRGVGASKLSRFSHIWGEGGVLARIEDQTIPGQFGMVFSDLPLQVNVVIDVVREGFKPTEIAQRIAHENGHSQDHLRGRVATGGDFAWSETSRAKIFSKCGVPARYATSLQACRRRHPAWFSFHPTSYAAERSAEFYSKMIDEWVREQLSLVPVGRYRCRSQETLGFWNEMETNLLGEKVSTPCRAFGVDNRGRGVYLRGKPRWRNW